MLALLDIPAVLVQAILTKADFRTLTRLRRTCSSLNELSVLCKERCSRNKSKYEFHAVGVESEIKYYVRRGEEGERIEIEYPLEQLCGLGILQVTVDLMARDQDKFDNIVETLAKMNNNAANAINSNLGLSNVVKIADMLRATYIQFNEEEDILSELMTNSDVQKYGRIGIRIENCTFDFKNTNPSIIKFIRNFSTFSLGMISKVQMKAILLAFFRTSDFGRLDFASFSYLNKESPLNEVPGCTAFKTFQLHDPERVTEGEIGDWQPYFMHVMESPTHFVCLEEFLPPNLPYINVVPVKKPPGTTELDKTWLMAEVDKIYDKWQYDCW